MTDAYTLEQSEACCGFYEVIKLGEVVHMILSSSNVIWNNIMSKNRNMIRKAMLPPTCSFIKPHYEGVSMV